MVFGDSHLRSFVDGVVNMPSGHLAFGFGFTPGNIIKKVIGQKFVYKFVSFPEILKMDPHTVELGRESMLLQDSDSLSLETKEQQTLSALRNTGRNDYIHSGLYSSFTINSLQNQAEVFKSIKMEKQDEKSDDKLQGEETRTVIRFVTNKTEKHVTLPVVSMPSSPMSAEAVASAAFLTSSASAKASPTLMSAHTTNFSSPSPSSFLSGNRSPNPEADDLELSSQPLNLSASHKARSPQLFEKRHSNGLPPKAKKPKGLEISASSLLFSGTDIGSIALNSPTLPSGSLTPAFFTAQNIIKKVIGQKFVYKFVSFPEILKMDPHTVELGRESMLLQDSDSLNLETKEQQTLSALRNTGRNDYIHSGLYSSFTINSLQNQAEVFKSIKMEKQDEKSDDKLQGEETRTVIRFVTNKTEKHVTLPVVSMPSSPMSAEAVASAAFLTSSASAKASPTLMSAHTTNFSSPSPSSFLSGNRSPNPEADDLELSSQPLNLSASHKARSPQLFEKRNSNGLPPKAKKPKGLEISASSLLFSGTDIGSIALNSPALPSGSLTPAFFTAQNSFIAWLTIPFEELVLRELRITIEAV
ncbi:UNVERIFIED_CONTAM: hypothetical protein FKN15_024223 [Acipenser sinensis]